MVKITGNSDFKRLNLPILQTYQPRLQYVRCADGYQMPITVVGTGSPVLMVHALGMDARQFLPFILPLADKFCFYLPHLRGFGLSAQHPTSPTTQANFIEQYTDDIECVLDDICAKYHTDAIDVAAISMGALVMWAYFNRHFADTADQTYKHRNRVKRYLNIDQAPSVHHLPDWRGGVFGEHQQQIFAQFKEVIEATLPYLTTTKAVAFTHLPFALKRKITQLEHAFSLMSVHRVHAKWLTKLDHLNSHHPSHKLALYQHSNWQQKLLCVQAYLIYPYDYRAHIASINIPVTMLIGGKSKLYHPKWQRKIAQQLPYGKVVQLENSGHAIPLDAPIAFFRALKDFLENE